MKMMITINKFKIFFIGFLLLNGILYAYNLYTMPSGNDFNFSNAPEVNNSNYKEENNLSLNELNETSPKPIVAPSSDYNKSVPRKPPAPNYSTMFPTAEDVKNKENTPMVGNDGLPTKDFNGSVIYYNNLGSVRVKKKIDENGRVYYVDAKTGKPVNINSYHESNAYTKAEKEYYDALYTLQQIKSEIAETNKEIENLRNKEQNVSSQEEKNEINAKINQLNDYLDNNLTKELSNQEIIVDEKLKAYKSEKYKEIDRAGYNPATLVNSSADVKNVAVSYGSSLVNNKMMSDSFKEYNNSNINKNSFVKQTIENSRKVNELYRDSYGLNIDNYSKQSPMVVDRNITNIINAYKAVDIITKEAENRLSNNYIKCYVSRELIPAYYCPLPGMDANTYPDYSNVKTVEDLEKAISTSPDDAEKTCDNLCKEKFSCVNYHILPSTNIDDSNATYTVFPRENYSNPLKITLNLNHQMALKDISFIVKIEPNLNNFNADFKDKNETFEQYYTAGKPIKIRMDAYAYYKDRPATLLVKNMVISIKNGTFVKVTLTPNIPMDKLILYFKKPYMYENQFLELNSKRAQNLFKKYISAIKIEDLKGEYVSTDLWFCPFKQIVNNQSDCKTPLLELKKGSSVIRICTDSDHKIGPEYVTGGFFSEKTCEDACIYREKCKPTYRQYKYINNLLGDTNGVYRIKVGCLNTPDNTRCTDQECKELFLDPKYRPNEEIVVVNDNKKIYTIRNKMLTGYPRPRINLQGELNANNDSNFSIRNNVFITEMKDAAYQNMINNQSYNVIKYKIGTESPRRQAYNLISYGPDKKTLYLELKPDSFKFDDGKTYYLYSVIKVESIYRPEYGVFILGADTAPAGTTIDGESGTFHATSYYVDATKHPLVLKDIMYAIKDPSQPTGWKVFREEYFNQIRVTKLKLVCYDSQGKEYISDYNPNQSFTACTEDQVITTVNDTQTKVPKNCCYVTPETRWVDYAGSHIDRNAFYDPNSDSFLTFDANTELAPYYASVKFTSDQPIYKYKILDSLMGTPHEIPGLLFHSQKEKDNGQSFRRVFQGGWQPVYNALLGNIEVYNFYSDTKLTYQEVLNNLTEENKFFDLYNQDKYPRKIVSDSQFDNNIKLFKLGAPNKLSVQVDIKPKIDEENQKVFKFVFLKDFIKSLTPITVDNTKETNETLDDIINK